MYSATPTTLGETNEPPENPELHSAFESAGILIVDPFPVWRFALDDIAHSMSFGRIDTTDCGPCALELLGSRTYDLILLDIDIPTLGAARELCSALHKLPSKPKTVVLGSYTLDSPLSSSLFGCDKYVSKRSDLNEIRKALASVMWTSTKGLDTSTDLMNAPWLLSPREAQVRQMMLLGLSNSEIGTLLNLSGQTVRNYASSVLQKLDCASRNDLVRATKINDLACRTFDRRVAQTWRKFGSAAC